MNIAKILLPVDLSARGKGAAHYAKTLACRFHSELTVLHVFELPNLITSGQDAGLPLEWHEELRTEAQRMLDEYQVEEFRDLSVRRMLLEGDAARKIIDLAHKDKTDLIVMPTHGYGRFRRFLIGSVTAKVLHDADCAVLTGVHIENVQTPEPLLFRNVMCAVDFDAAGEKALRWAARFATEFGARLTVIHALPVVDAGQTHYSDPALPMVVRQAGQERLEELQRRAGTNADVVLAPGPVSGVVHDAAASQNADLVVIGRHENPGLLGRLRANAYAIVRESPCPVVSV